VTRVVLPGARSGCVRAPASKSMAHRLLICAALGESPVTVVCDSLSDDINATIGCLNALGAAITRGENGRLAVSPIVSVPRGLCRLPCGESGSTLRFLLPVVGALGANAVFEMKGRLPERPLEPLAALLTEHGMTLRREKDLLYCSGQLSAGDYTIPGNISSQYISGLLLALPLLRGDSTLTVTGKIESAAYIEMTLDALAAAACAPETDGRTCCIRGDRRPRLSDPAAVEGDWSSAAFFLCMGALSEEGVTVTGLDVNSTQGDRAVARLLGAFGADVSIEKDRVTVRRGELHGIEVDAAPIPDLIPVLAVVAAKAEGETRFVNAGRLRLKESDRLSSTANLLRALGGDVDELESGLVVRGGRLLGGKADSCGDHRIAMAAATAATACEGPVTVSGSECTAKSYPRFWDDLDSLKGGRI